MMSKISNENRADQIIEALEIFVESKYQILKELDYENHSESNKIKTTTYEPVKKLLKELFDFHKK